MAILPGHSRGSGNPPCRCTHQTGSRFRGEGGQWRNVHGGSGPLAIHNDRAMGGPRLLTVYIMAFRPPRSASSALPGRASGWGRGDHADLGGGDCRARLGDAGDATPVRPAGGRGLESVRGWSSRDRARERGCGRRRPGDVRCAYCKNRDGQRLEVSEASRCLGAKSPLKARVGGCIRPIRFQALTAAHQPEAVEAQCEVADAGALRSLGGGVHGRQRKLPECCVDFGGRPVRCFVEPPREQAEERTGNELHERFPLRRLGA